MHESPWLPFHLENSQHGLASLHGACLWLLGNGVQPSKEGFSERCLLQRWRLKVAYDGSEFRGWQALGDQGARTVHRTLTAAVMASHPLHSRHRQAPVLVGCSRTDRGVHSEGQVAHADLLSLPDLDADTLRRRVNCRLPGDVQTQHPQSSGGQSR